MRISDWSSDVCSSDLNGYFQQTVAHGLSNALVGKIAVFHIQLRQQCPVALTPFPKMLVVDRFQLGRNMYVPVVDQAIGLGSQPGGRSEEHTSELQSLMRISYAVFSLKKKNTRNYRHQLESRILTRGKQK